MRKLISCKYHEDSQTVELLYGAIFFYLFSCSAYTLFTNIADSSITIAYLNLYAFTINPPVEPLEKVEKIINLVFENPKSLRYRDQFG